VVVQEDHVHAEHMTQQSWRNLSLKEGTVWNPKLMVVGDHIGSMGEVDITDHYLSTYSFGRKLSEL